MKIGSLFTGAGMLDVAVEAVFKGKTVWQAEIDPAASKVLAYHRFDIPNLGDVTKIDWATVERVDILCGGFPCQDVSAAGKKAGIREGTRSGLWSVFVEAIDALQPRVVVIENVKGLLSAKAVRTVSVESGSADVGAGYDRPLRAAGAVLGDLSERGYNARWATVPASDAGAPHRRDRVFILATNSRNN
jgi:DNA (cytosine-5)-methyltransferase 1